MNSMKSSPAICSLVRTHRVQEMQRSRSSSTSVEIGTGLSNSRLGSMNRDSPRPLDIAWFCSGHSPPLSHIGQSRGWLISRNSITPCCALSATAEVSCVLTTMPSVHVVVQEASGLRWPSISTRHWRQAPIGSSSGWSQNRGIWTPSSSAARMTRVPFGTETWRPSIVTVTVSVEVVCAVIGFSPLAHAVEAAGSNRQPPFFWCAMISSRKYWMADMIGAGAASPRAQNARPMMFPPMSFSLSRSSSVPLPSSIRCDHPHHPVRALPARRALAARLVLVELRPAQRGAHARRWCHRRSAAPLSRASTRPRPRPRSPAGRPGAHGSAAAWTTRRESRTSAGDPAAACRPPG